MTIFHPHLNPPPSEGEETRRMDSRLRGNDIGRSGNDIKEKGEEIGPSPALSPRRERVRVRGICICISNWSIGKSVNYSRLINPHLYYL